MDAAKIMDEDIDNIEESDLFVEDVLTREVKKGRTKSFYAEHGDIFSYLCMIISFFMILGNFMLRSRKSSESS